MTNKHLTSNIILNRSKMLLVCCDLILKIGEPLTDREKIRLTLTCQSMDQFKNKFRYHENIYIDKIIHLSYFDNFESVNLLKIRDKKPKYAKYVYHKLQMGEIATYELMRGFYVHWEYKYPIKKIKKLFEGVTHLEFCDDFNHSIKNIIPISVTRLTFGMCFNQPIYDRIPASVTHLTFGERFNQSIENCIPSSVTHLTFGKKFDQPIKNCIPLFVTHLSFGSFFNQSLGSIPASVIQIKVHRSYRRDMNDPRIIMI